jgi:hypothetical protein
MNDAAANPMPTPRWYRIRMLNVCFAMIWLSLALATWRHNYHLDVRVRPFEALSVYFLVFGSLGIACGVLVGRLVWVAALAVVAVGLCVVCEITFWQP